VGIELGLQKGAEFCCYMSLINDQLAVVSCGGLDIRQHLQHLGQRCVDALAERPYERRATGAQAGVQSGPVQAAVA